MKLLDIYSMMESGDLNEEGAAAALGTTLKDLRFRVTRWGNRLPLVLSIMDKLRDERISRQDAAEALGVTPRQVNALMNTWKVVKPPKAYLIERRASKVKWEVHKKFAIDFIAGSGSIDDAAEGADVSTRQMRRLVSQLIDKHYGMVFKDLRTLSLARRRRLAQEIETAEGLELTKQQALSPVLRGEKTIQEEALDRVIAEKPKYRRLHAV